MCMCVRGYAFLDDDDIYIYIYIYIYIHIFKLEAITQFSSAPTPSSTVV